MTRFNSFVQAEKAAWEGSNESQDSQAILDAFKAEFGVVGAVRVCLWHLVAVNLNLAGQMASPCLVSFESLTLEISCNR